MSLVVCIAGSVLLLVDLVLLALTYMPALAPVGAVFPPIFAAVFPLFLWAVIAALRLRKSSDGTLVRRMGIDVDALVSGVPRIALGTILAVVAAAVVIFVTTSPSSGQRQYDHATHTYRLDNQIVDRSTYLTAIESVNRLFLSGSAIFLAFSVLVTLNHCYRRRDRSNSPQLDR
ncbi:hypothetical protein [Nocardia sp. NPDC020380]|uniref:hypothetical protein n=1 Tax=Nocardia sp. NPDC020380 TaxID=3364309 RepID=UPI0037A20192